MAEIIIIRGEQNSGKTTLCGLVYKKLLEYANIEHIFNNNQVTIDSLKYNNQGETLDFEAILTINNKKVCILSDGDIASDVKSRIEIRININVEIKIDILICCSRSINRAGSTYRMILDNFSKTNNIVLEVSSKYDNNKFQKNEIKMSAVDKIINEILIRTIKTPLSLT